MNESATRARIELRGITVDEAAAVWTQQVEGGGEALFIQLSTPPPVRTRLQLELEDGTRVLADVTHVFETESAHPHGIGCEARIAPLPEGETGEETGWRVGTEHHEPGRLAKHDTSARAGSDDEPGPSTPDPSRDEPEQPVEKTEAGTVIRRDSAAPLPRVEPKTTIYGTHRQSDEDPNAAGDPNAEDPNSP